MSEDLKKNIILQMIKAYKNRLEWADEYIEENYSNAIEYMMKNFDRFYKLSKDGAISSIKQGDRSVTYRDVDVIHSDHILVSLLGKPLMRCY